MRSVRLVHAILLSLAWLAIGSQALAGPQLLIDARSGQVLFADAPDRPWFPASLTKMMTTYVVLEEVKAGKLAFDSKVTLSDYARSQPATRIGLRLGIELNIEQALRGLLLRSANDFAVALAETVSGSEAAFAERMNAAAKRLGMSRSQFRNPHGLPHDEQVTTARDMAILARALLEHFPDRAELFSTREVRIHRQTFHSQNDLLRVLEGADGMKTGFTCGAGYNVVASATRDGVRLIAVVFGEQTRQKRSVRAAGLIEHGFQVYPWREMLPAATLSSMRMEPADTMSPPDASATVRMRKCRAPGPRPVAAAVPVADASGASTGNGAIKQPGAKSD